MIVFLPIRLAPTGGTSTFAKKLQQGLRQHGHEVVFQYQRDYDVLLVSPGAPLQYLIEAWRRGKKIIHRLDGVYYPMTTAGWVSWGLNARLALTRHLFAHHTIYQSQYARFVCDKFLGKTGWPATTVYNGVDTQLFSPEGKQEKLRHDPAQHLFITASRFRRPDQIMPLLAAFDIYQKRYHRHSAFIIIGNFVGVVQDIPQRYANRSAIHFVGMVPNERLPGYLRAADVFLFSHLNPPCPNNVIEAMACGLPICGVADGAMPELVRSGVDGMLLPVESDGFYVPRPFDEQAFVRNMSVIMERRSAMTAQCVQKVRENFSLEKMVAAYVRVLQ